jgi:hypothetical protein
MDNLVRDMDVLLLVPLSFHTFWVRLAFFLHSYNRFVYVVHQFCMDRCTKKNLIVDGPKKHSYTYLIESFSTQLCLSNKKVFLITLSTNLSRLF